MKPILQLLFVSFAALLSPAAYANRPANDASTVLNGQIEIGEDEKVFLDAVSDFLSGRAADARTELESILRIYPRSQVYKAALLALADSYYIKGGNDNSREAEAGYRKFLLIFPDDRLADAVRIKLADTYIRWTWFGDRGAGLGSAKRELEELIWLNPAGRKRKEAEVRLGQIYEHIAEHEMKVARFYYDVRGAPEAARLRTEEILNKYQGYSQFDEALFYHARATADAGDAETAAEDLLRLLCLYPQSKYRDQAVTLLAQWGFSVAVPGPETPGRQTNRENTKQRPLHRILITDFKTIPAEGIILDRNLTPIETLVRAQRLCSKQRPI